MFDTIFTNKYLVNPGLQVFPGYHPSMQEQAFSVEESCL